jgi:hypothetical protein
VKEYESDWTEDQRGLYDESYAIGYTWATDPDTPVDETQEVLNLAEADDDELGGLDLEYPPLVDAVAEATGEDVMSVPARRDHPAFRGFVDGARDATAGDVFGL